MPCRIRVVMFCVCCVLQKQEMGVMLEMGRGAVCRQR